MDPRPKKFVLFRAERLAVALVAAAFLTGCSWMMPAEIKTLERDSSAGAARLGRERPEAFHTVTAGGRAIHYVEVTDDAPKPLIVFIHGSPGDWTAWVRYLNDPELRQKAHMIALDRPGFGGSGGGEVERSLARQAEEIAPLLDKRLPGQKVLMVGHSYGGPVAVRLAMDYGSRVTDVLLLAGAVDPDLETTKWYQYVADWRLVAWMVPTPLVVANREIRALKPELERMGPLWGRVTQRVSVMQGDRDDLVPPANADFAEKMLVNASEAEVIRIPGMNHFIPWTRYEAVKAEILRHLE